MRRSTGATFIVVTDRNGIRYSHPNPALIGKPVDENPAPVLAGQQWVGAQRGTLGDSARGKTPIWYHGRVIGMASVGYLESAVGDQLLRELPGYELTVLIVVILGVGGSLLLARRLKRQTFGLEPYEIAGLLEEREASLQGIREGALATDRQGRITLANPEAQRLIALPADAVGKKVSQVVPPGRLADFIAGTLQDDDELLLVADKVLLGRRRPVVVRGREIGTVITLLDTGELNQLSGAAGMANITDALRAQAHEFSNRLHTIAGLIELGRPEEAMSLIDRASQTHQELSEALIEQLGDPVLGALLLAKAAIASERGVELVITADSLTATSPLSPNDLIAIVGNLVDNALDAASNSRDLRRVTITVGSADAEFLIQVRDSGPGVPDALADRVFAEGFSTKPKTPGRPRGLGLALVRETVRRYHGQLTLTNDAGAVFTVSLPVASDIDPLLTLEVSAT
jgi:two-component system CitB family sensor kinase